MSQISAHRGEFLHLLDNPATASHSAEQHFPDGLMLIKDGHIEALGPAEEVINSLPADTEINHHKDALIIPGLIDTHIHYPQTGVVAAYGTQLLEWLENYTFPAERSFEDFDYARGEAAFFLDELIRNGTTTALVFGTVHKQSVDAFFTEAQKRNLRMICGKVMMDRNAPDYLCDTPDSSWSDSRELILRWHNTDRLSYAVTPRFAPTSSDEQLGRAGELLQEFSDVYLQTHLSENKQECEWVKSLFPQRENYLDVYDHYGLLGKRSVFAHGIYLSDEEWQRLHDTDSALSFCPCSNLFIGSGLFDYHKAQHYNVKTGIGTDVGGGDSFSLLRTLNEAYKVQQLQNHNLSPYQSLYLATLGGAIALDLNSYIGNFELGKEADFIVLDYKATPLIERRINNSNTTREKLFAMMMLGDDRLVRETWILGQEQKRMTV